MTTGGSIWRASLAWIHRLARAMDSKERHGVHANRWIQAW